MEAKQESEETWRFNSPKGSYIFELIATLEIKNCVQRLALSISLKLVELQTCLAQKTAEAQETIL